MKRTIHPSPSTATCTPNKHIETYPKLRLLLVREVFPRLHLCRHTFVSLWGDCYVLPHFDALTHVVIRVSSALLFVFVKRKYFKSLLKVYYLSVFVESSKAFNTLSLILLWIKPSYFLAWLVTVFGKCVRLLMHASMKPRCLSRQLLCHKVNLPSWVVARRPLCHTKEIYRLV